MNEKQKRKRQKCFFLLRSEKKADVQNESGFFVLDLKEKVYNLPVNCRPQVKHTPEFQSDFICSLRNFNIWTGFLFTFFSSSFKTCKILYEYCLQNTILIFLNKILFFFYCKKGWLLRVCYVINKVIFCPVFFLVFDLFDGKRIFIVVCFRWSSSRGRQMKVFFDYITNIF